MEVYIIETPQNINNYKTVSQFTIEPLFLKKNLTTQFNNLIMSCAI